MFLRGKTNPQTLRKFAIATGEDGSKSVSGNIPTIVKHDQKSIIIQKRIVFGTDDIESVKFGKIWKNVWRLRVAGADSINAVGLQFTELDIPQGAIINSAYLQFTCSKRKKDAPAMTIIRGTVSDNVFFTKSLTDTSGSMLTTRSILWKIPSWGKKREAEIFQRTPDLKAIIQEMVNRSECSDSSSFAFVFSGKSSRNPVFFEQSPANSVLLYIDYSVKESAALSSCEEDKSFQTINRTYGKRQADPSILSEESLELY